MATTKERILITLTPSASKALRARATREKTPRASIAARFVEFGLLEVPTLTLSPKGEAQALRAVRSYARGKATGKLVRLSGGLADLV